MGPETLLSSQLVLPSHLFESPKLVSLPTVSFYHNLNLSLNFSLPISSTATHTKKKQDLIVLSAWTRRSRGELERRPNRKSWKQRTDMYMRPFILTVFFSKRFIHAKVMHRFTCKVVSVASTSSRDLRYSLASLTDENACRAIGNLIAERSMEADVFAMSFEPSKNERVGEGKLGILLDAIKQNGIIFY